VLDRRITHLDEQGRAHMVDVAAKPITSRRAVAHAVVHLTPEVVRQIQGGRTRKGEVLAVARVAGIQAAKETARLIPLCHPLALTSVALAFKPRGRSAIEVVATAAISGRTGVEMEALTAAAVAALTIYDMVKSTCRGATITDLELLEKDGGRSGLWRRPRARAGGRRQGARG
jgi:cyclic pyranopterin phosphate synthase